jgi:hypothetical protein
MMYQGGLYQGGRNSYANSLLCESRVFCELRLVDVVQVRAS